jgi:V8-like Glu-specific endopeptidase
MIGSLETRGTLNPPYSNYHALGAFLKDLVENNLVSHDAAIKIGALLFGYTLIKDRQYVEKLSAQFQIPSLLLTDEQLINHPFSLTSSIPDLKPAKNLQDRFEALYNQRSFLLKVNFLIEGAKAASSVCRIEFNNRSEGTGFLVAPDLILTNFHVMKPPFYTGDVNMRAQKCEVKFGVIEGTSAKSPFKLHATKWLQAESKLEDLDFILLKLDRPVTMNDQIMPLSLESKPVQKGDFVNIIQHPRGRSMEVSLRFNEVVKVTDKRICYLADTENGSSGSPVFDDSWRLVALHHAGQGLDEEGNTIPANEGIPINAIKEQIAPFI